MLKTSRRRFKNNKSREAAEGSKQNKGEDQEIESKVIKMTKARIKSRNERNNNKTVNNP
jgi:hypothetical protein